MLVTSHSELLLCDEHLVSGNKALEVGHNFFAHKVFQQLVEAKGYPKVSQETIAGARTVSSQSLQLYSSSSVCIFQNF